MTENEEFEFRHRLEQEQGNEKTLPGFLGNVVKDIPDMAIGFGQTLKEGALDMPSRALQTGLEMAAGKPYAETSSGKRDVEIVQNAPEQLKELVRPVAHPIDYGYEHPIQQTLNALAIASPLVEGAAGTVGRYAGQAGEEAMGRLHGVTRAQYKQLGDLDFGHAMRESYDLGDADMMLGPIGRRQMVNERVNQIGSEIGNVRDTAKDVVPATTGTDVAQQLRKALTEGDYAPSGKYNEQLPRVERLLKQIEAIQDTSPSALAHKATELNDLGTGNKLVQAKHAPETHVANALSQFNDARINEALPDLADHYGELREAFGEAKSLQPMELAGQGKEVTGASSNTLYGTVKKIGHSLLGGPKIEAKAAFGAEKALQNVAENTGAYGIGGVTTSLMSRLSSNPQSLGKYAAPLIQAAQKGGNQAVAATHYILSTSHPEYNQMLKDNENQQ